MRIIKIFQILLVRSLKLIIFYLFMSPFFILRIIFVKKHSVRLSFIDKFLILLIGEVYIFGKKKVDLRGIYEYQRKYISNGISKKSLLFFIPGQWYSLSPLESSLLILMMPKHKSNMEKILLFPYVFFIFLFDESRDKIQANHGIASALSLSIAFQYISKISRYYYFIAISILRRNSNYFFYDEGSTNYHIFVTYLFKNYFHHFQKSPRWIRGYDEIAIQLIRAQDYFYFGDDDNSRWLYKERYMNTMTKPLSIIDLISNFNFKKSIIDRYFKIFTKDTAILLICINGCVSGHAHYMIGSILYFVDNKCYVKFKKNSSYTFDKSVRQKERLHSCNSPIAKSNELKSKLAFFKRLTNNLTSVHLYQNPNYKLSITGNGWQRLIDYSNKTLKIVDSTTSGETISCSLLYDKNSYIRYATNKNLILT